jgi:hypothetical protein
MTLPPDPAAPPLADVLPNALREEPLSRARESNGGGHCLDWVRRRRLRGIRGAGTSGAIFSPDPLLALLPTERGFRC